MAKVSPLWMPHYIAEHLAAAHGLSSEQELAYLRLQWAYWQAGGPLPDVEEDLALIARLSLPAWRKAAAKLSRFFTIEDGHWHHAKLDEELAKAAGFINQRAAAGRASAAKRRNGESTIVPTGRQRPLQREGNGRPNGRATADPTGGQPTTTTRV